MNKKQLDKVAMKFIKDKLSLNILNNIYEICEYLSGNNNYENIGEEFLKIKNKLPSHFLNIKQVIGLSFEERASFIKEINEDIQNLEKLAFPLLSFLSFCDLLTTILSDYYQIKLSKFEGDIQFDKSTVLKDIFNLIDKEDEKNTLSENGGIFLSLVNCSMTKENYSDYIKRSLEILFEGANKRMTDASFETLKFKFAPFVFLPENGDKQQLMDIFNLNLKEKDIEGISDILNMVKSKEFEYTNKLGDLRVIYGCLMDILAVYNFTVDFDYLFIDDFVLKDMFLSTCEMIENNDYEIMLENIQSKLDDKLEEFMDKLAIIDVIKKQVSRINFNDYSDIIKVCVSLDEYSSINLEKSVLFKSEEEDEPLTKEFLEYKIDEFLDFISNLKIDNTFLKKLEQQFFFYIPCPLNNKEIKAYFDIAFSGLKPETSVLVSYKFLAFTDPQKFNKYLSVGNEHHHNCDHQHHDEECNESCCH